MRLLFLKIQFPILSFFVIQIQMTIFYPRCAQELSEKKVVPNYFPNPDLSEDVIDKKRRSSPLREDGENTLVAQMTVFDKNR